MMVPSAQRTGRALAPWPQYEKDEIEAAAAVLRSGRVNYWTGEEGRQFEEEFARATECEHAVALANGSVALELALHALQVPKGSRVIVSPRTFIASASACVVQDMIPVFADVDSDSQNITPESVEPLLTEGAGAIICVHHAGWPCDMETISKMAHQAGIPVIEDCAQAHGAQIGGRSVGSWSDAGAWSFCQDKVISTGGEGGMLTTSRTDVWERAWSYKDHGKGFRKVYEPRHTPGYRWVHESIGTNWRLTEPQAAIGRRQLAKLPDWSARRQENAHILESRLRHIDGLRVPMPEGDLRHAWYRLYAFVEPDSLQEGWSRDRLLSRIEEYGAPCFVGSCGEVYLEEALAPFRPESRLPTARKLGETSLAFLVHPTLTSEDMHFVADQVETAMQEARR